MVTDPAESITIESILSHFEDLPDPRSHINRRHLFGDMIVIAILAVIAGAEGPQAIGVWADINRQWLADRLQLPAGLPSHDTIGRVLAAVRPRAFQECFVAWLDAIGSGVPTDALDVIAIDGKALRRSHDTAKDLGPLFLVSAWAVQRGISLGQLATEVKSNEITAIPVLLDQIDVKSSVVTIDAAGCQKAIAQKIIDGQGDYVLACKGNQPKLHAAVVSAFERQIETDFSDGVCEQISEEEKSHGREDEIHYYQMPVAEMTEPLDQWCGIRSIAMAVRTSRRGAKESTDVRYYISSLKVDVATMSRCIRGHWAIENTLHWCLDVTFNEDANRVRDRVLADNLAWLKRFAISMLKQVDPKRSVAMKRRMAGWNPDYLAKVLRLTA